MISFQPSFQVLLVDPDEDFIFLMRSLLELADCHVQTAKDCTEALAAAEGRSFDFIFADLLPTGKVRIDMEMQLPFILPPGRAMIVALTGHYYPGIASDARNAGFYDYMCKPVGFQQILNLLEPIASRRAYRFNTIGFPEFVLHPGAAGGIMAGPEFAN